MGMAQFFTRTGDDGYTGLLGEGRVPKYHARPEAVGAIDEASAALGLARALSQVAETGPVLMNAQRDLYHLMAEIAATPENAARFRVIDTTRVEWLEEMTRFIGAKVELPREFILPGDSPGGAAVSVARTLVRRAERRVAELLHQGLVENRELLRYLNRLSSLCFVLELLENGTAGKATPTLAKEDAAP